MTGLAQADVATRAEGSAFHTAMAHLYRGEMHRMTVWRTRLDTTTNWAILLTTGLTTFTLGSAAVPHYTLLLGLALNTICMFMEGRRYQHLHHAQWRLRLIEDGYFATWLRSEACSSTWRTRLAADLREPRPTVCLLRAVRLRLRRNYVLLFYFITGVWLTKLFTHRGNLPESSLFQRMAVGDLVPSWVVAASASLFLVSITILAVATVGPEPIEHRCEPRALATPLGADAETPLRADAGS